MVDIFVTWIDDTTIVVYDAEKVELWRGRWEAIEVLRALAAYGCIGLYEDTEGE